MQLKIKPLPTRQVHLDFHTSEYLPDVGSEFDAAEFARTFKEAHVNSVTIFAKCHHGMCYYPTKVGIQHPSLKGRDLLGEMIEALHREGIRCPIYTTLAWEEDIARRFPQWRQMKKDGNFANRETLTDRTTVAPGLWKFNNWIHPDFMDYTEAHLREVLDNYAVDGIFFDIFTYHKEACWSEASVAFREKHGLMADDPTTQRRFIAKAQEHFASRFTPLVREKHPEATVFYNADYDLRADGGSGSRHLGRFVTHFELESLPSGFWGYQHFPRQARGVLFQEHPWIGMTGRFQKMWGDFGGIKPMPALEFECFRSQALGGGNSVGDQLPPRGRLEPAAYRLIGKVYEQCEAAEPFYEGSAPVARVGVVPAQATASEDVAASSLSDEGVLMMLAESHYEAAMIDGDSDLSGLELVILPDASLIEPKLRDKIQTFHQKGGTLLISNRSGYDSEGNWALSWLGLEPGEAITLYPSYWSAKESFWKEAADSDFVIYAPGRLPVISGGEWNPLIERKLPYFKRNDVKYCSHFQTPPRPEVEADAAVLEGDGVIWFGDPVFREYRQTGNKACYEAVVRCVERLIGKPLVGGDLPQTVQIVPRRKGNDLLLTLLHYIPQRKALDIDVIDTAHSFAGYEIAFDRPVETVTEGFGGEALKATDSGAFRLPDGRGRLLLKVAAYFEDNS
ncbi:MAG: alpha-L-fucosidase [Opitutales bacterium]|nr:alpha-L-fucosidase [Opitutales bacterium]